MLFFYVNCFYQQLYNTDAHSSWQPWLGSAVVNPAAVPADWQLCDNLVEKRLFEKVCACKGALLEYILDGGISQFLKQNGEYYDMKELNVFFFYIVWILNFPNI